MTTIRDIVKILTDSGIASNEANIEVKLLIEHFCGYTAKDIILGKPLDYSKLELVKEKAEYRAKTGEPIQYIIGLADFMGEKFVVNPAVLIPRDETELLVRRAVEIIGKRGLKKILDIGTGSGCIACMVAKLAECQVIGVDISTEALNVALDNASRLNLYNKAIFRKSDIFSNVRADEKFDMIISNPPYIPKKEQAGIQREVSFEPEMALYANDEFGTEFYEKITSGCTNVLNPGGYLLFELGIKQAKRVAQIMSANGLKVIDIEKDLAGINRVIVGKLKS